MKITQKELAEKLTLKITQFNINNSRMFIILDALKEIILEEVEKGNKVSLTGFGQFEKFIRHGRNVPNPQTGDIMRVKEVAVMKFRTGAKTKEIIKDAVL